VLSRFKIGVSTSSAENSKKEMTVLSKTGKYISLTIEIIVLTRGQEY
jgi:hypothetical protein